CISGLSPGHILEPVCDIASSIPQDIISERRSSSPNLEVPFAHGMTFILDELSKVK
ncbi:hypothetical protein TorRG33x02_000130, partial [Trema orientale]